MGNTNSVIEQSSLPDPNPTFDTGLPIVNESNEDAKKVRCIYSALFVVSHTQTAQAWITQFYLQLHQCLPLPFKRSPDGASLD